MRTLNEERLERIREYIVSYQKQNGRAPSYRQVQKAFQMSSLNLVQRYILRLERDGKIERTRLGGIAVMPQFKSSGTVMTPLLGDIACGQPMDAVENIEESFALPQALFGGGELFMLRAHGDSMKEIGIKRGDFIVVKKQNTADEGDIVVAMVNGATTLKRFYRRKGKIVLHPENREMKDIVVNECEIQGILVSCIKMF